MGRLVPAQGFPHGAHNFTLQVLFVTVSVLQKIFPFDHFSAFMKMLEDFCFVFIMNGARSGLWVANVLLVFKIYFPTCGEEHKKVSAVDEMYTGIWKH